jgi:spermidine/putrescine transport system ATP-binding protein
MANTIINIKGLSKRYQDQTVLDNISFDVYDGEFLTLLGPSGCGKTTLLRLIAGFEQLDAGSMTLHNQDVSDLPPQQRKVNTVFQSFALFPHMSVYENVAFGLRIAGDTEIDKHVMEALRMVKLENFARRKPHQLSGGQQQRVAIARAVVNKPLVLLLDEPLSALDYQLRKNMQFELKNLQRQLGITFILVTHDQEEALSMADRVVIMNHGHIEQIGTPREVYEEPHNLHIATFIGQANIFDGEILEANEEQVALQVEGKVFPLKNKRGFKKGDKAHLLLRPEDIYIWDKIDVTHPGLMIAAHVEQFIYKGSTIDLILKCESGKLVFATEFFDEDDDKLEYHIGDAVWLEWIPGWEVILPYDQK